MSIEAPWLYLASQSPRRRQLLEQWGLRCELLLPDPHEDAEGLEVVRPNEAPASYVKRVTRLKLEHALLRLRARCGALHQRGALGLHHGASAGQVMDVATEKAPA